MNKSKEIQRLVIASSLIAISIVINVFFKQILNFNNFGVPFDAIPIIYGSIILGPIYGITMGYVADLLGFIAFPTGAYIFLFALGSMVWGFVPGLILHKKFDPIKLAVTIFVTHILVTLANTIGMLLFLPIETALATLPLRLTMVPINVIIISLLVNSLYKKMLPVLMDMEIKKTREKSETKTSEQV